jgi:hypothetical protein
LRIVVSPDGLPELESIVDDEEWENVSELYDELTFPGEDTRINVNSITCTGKGRAENSALFLLGISWKPFL